MRADNVNGDDRSNGKVRRRRQKSVALRCPHFFGGESHALSGDGAVDS